MLRLLKILLLKSETENLKSQMYHFFTHTNYEYFLKIYYKASFRYTKKLDFVNSTAL